MSIKNSGDAIRNQTRDLLTHANKDLITYAATLPNYPRWCILIYYFNKNNFGKLK
jgi:hypothetical protein